MTDEPPNADRLEVVISPDGKWALFDFIIGQRHAQVTMRTATLPETVTSLMQALMADSLKEIPRRGLDAGTYFQAVAVPAIETGSSTVPLGEAVTVDFELPGGVQIHIQMHPRDAKILQAAIAAALRETAESQPSTKQ